jgi:hypothetical protein
MVYGIVLNTFFSAIPFLIPGGHSWPICPAAVSSVAAPGEAPKLKGAIGMQEFSTLKHLPHIYLDFDLRSKVP